jgi:NAD(P)-dependent dehydrogenase (short-subunit alcohol dehydrogenase family)
MKALVTGGSSGIGAEICRLVLEAGGQAVSLDRDAPRGGVPFVQCDVGDEQAVVAAVAEAAATMGGLDRAFLNAGIGGVGGILDLSGEAWDAMHRVDLRGVFLCLRECARLMVGEGGGGSIVVTSSISSFLADRRMSHYNSAKAGANQLVRIAAAELGPHGVRVNAIAPGVTATPMAATTDETLPGYKDAVASRTPLGGIGPADAVAEAAIALSDMRWVTGQILAADGGVSLFSPIDVEDFLPAGAKEPWVASSSGVSR